MGLVKTDALFLSGDEASSLLKALAQVDKLEELGETLVGEKKTGDDQVTVEGGPVSIVYGVNFNTNFEDRNGFITGIAKYIEEATIHAALNELLVEGEQHAVTLYTWRCISRGVQQPKSDDDPNRIQIYEACLEVLTPEVGKLFSLMKFEKIAIERFCTEIKVLCHPEKKKQFVSEAYLITLGKFINMFAVLDELKNIKASVKNDFSTYKRAAQFLKRFGDMQTLQESQNLSLFLATQNKIRNSLKENLEKIQGYEEILCEVINICVDMFEGRMYLLPSEKHMLVKVIGFSLDLIDNDKCNIYKLDHKKKLKIEKIDKIFKLVQVVPLYGDMQISPFQYVRRSRNFDANKWPLCSPLSVIQRHLPSQIDMVRALPLIQQDHMKFVCELHEISSGSSPSISLSSEEDEAIKSDKVKMEERKTDRICSLAMKGLRYLSDWVALVSEHYSWKLLNPTDHHQNRDCPPDAEEYERATRYNYTPEEKSALVQLIALIKGLQMTLLKMEDLFTEHIRKNVYFKLQNFVQLTLREPVRKATKNKKNVLRSVLLSIRDTSGDFIKSSKISERDSVLKGEKSPANYEELYKFEKRSVGPSSTQLYLLRTMLESLLSDKTCANRILKKDIEQSCIPSIEAFHRQTFFWGHLQNFGEIIWRIGDLSQFWYREFYLEMTMGKRIQFPIEMSMPWILMNHVLDNPVLMEFALFPLDLYNDSCNCALNVFRKQFLYNELEAEVNLCFDQFVYKVSEQIFSHYKKTAANNLLQNKFKLSSKMKQDRNLIPPSKHYRYDILMRQRRVQLLGHFIDLSKLIQQRISRDLLKSLEVAIRRFQEGDLTAVVQLEGLISVNRDTHKLLKPYLGGLTEFEMLWKEANYNVTSEHGRTTIHIFCEINWDLLSNYCYNGSTERFVLAKGHTFSQKALDHREQPLPSVAILPQYLWGSKQLNLVYASAFGMYSGFIGEPHFKAMVKVLGYKGLAVIMQELLKVLKELLQGPIYEFTKEMMGSMPKNCKVPLMPLADEGSPGMLAFYLDVLHDILHYPNVRLKLLQNFREVGNAIVFFLQMEKTLYQEENWMLVHAAPLQSIYPKPKMAEDEDDDDFQKRIKLLEKQHAPINFLKNIETHGSTCQKKLVKEVDLLERERLCCGLSIFQEILTKVKGFLEENAIWKGSTPENLVMNLDEGTEFYRLWSAIQFGFAIPPGINESSIEQLFGDGLNWAGCTIITLLDQQKRFELMDFSNRVQQSQRCDRMDNIIKGIPLVRICQRIRCFQSLNFQIFQMLRRHTTSDNPANKVPFKSMRYFPAPIHKSLNEKRKSKLDMSHYEDIQFNCSASGSRESKIGEGDQATPASLSVLYQYQNQNQGEEEYNLSGETSNSSCTIGDRRSIGSASQT